MWDIKMTLSVYRREDNRSVSFVEMAYCCSDATRVLMLAIFQKLTYGIKKTLSGMTRTGALPRSARAAASPAVSREAREKSENLFDSIKANLSPSRDKFSRIKS